MAITREQLLDLLATYGNNSYNNIDYIVTTNSDVIRMSWYKRPGCGVNWVDKNLGASGYRTGVELYAPIPHSVESGLDENGKKAITFIEVEMIDHISFKVTEPPGWAWDNPNLSDLTVDGATVAGFDKDVIHYDVELAFGTVDVPVVAATTENPNGTVEVTQAASVTGTAQVVATAEDGTTEKVYTITFSVAAA